MLSPLIAFLCITIAALFDATLASPLLPINERRLEVVKRDNTTLAAPIVATPSQHWEGNDGSWSTFEIRVGTPPSVYRVLPFTSWQEVWLIWQTASICNTSRGVDSNCAEARGGSFEDKNSSTWKPEGEFALGLNNVLGYDGNANYGFDTVGLGYTNDTGPTLTHQIVAEIISDDSWLGALGIGFQPSNFSDYGNPQPSFSDSLASNGSIASRSWSYTAGAPYRLKSVFGSLIFGGYDASRFKPNDVVFYMGPDNLRDLLVSIQNITATTSSGSTSLSSNDPGGELYFLDSSVPEFWLPVDVCQKFEKAFGLKMDEATGLYLVDGSTHAKLLSDNPNITFTLGNTQKDGHTVDITLPYASFDLNVSAPIYPHSGSSYYFPLRQAQNSSMYTLGRTFFQEAYVTAEYETRTFNVSQCVFEVNAQSTILAVPSSTITPKSGGSGGHNNDNNDNNSGSGGKSKLSGGAIGGIVVGVIGGLVLLGAILFCCLRGMLCFGRRESRSSTPVAEADGKRIEKQNLSSPESTQASGVTSEMPGQDAKVEIAGNPIMHPQELEAEVPLLATSNTNHRSDQGQSDGSGPQTEVSAMSSSPHDRPAELQAAGRRPTNGPSERPVPSEPSTPSSVSPSSPIMQRNRGFGPDITVSSPIDEVVSPRTPVQHESRFEERWSHPGL